VANIGHLGKWSFPTFGLSTNSFLMVLHLLCAVWLGAGLGLLISIFFAAIFIAIYYSLDKEVFSGKSEMIFSGVISVIASVMITILAFGMLKMMALQDKWTRKLKKSATEVSVHHLIVQSKVFYPYLD
jgi:high-affinity Fe2+/Pb2+ permease